tara:strand:- start:19631 stop:20536 length:906 start_codon:yes stop_codon:yes gene_type:complete
MNRPSVKIGFIGLGVMGEPICRNIIRKSGLTGYAFDFSGGPLERLAGDGVQAASSVHDLGGKSDIVFLSLPGGPEVEAVICGPEGLLKSLRPGCTIVDLSTTPVELTRRLALAAKANGISYADAPVARTRQAAEDGTLSIMVGASAEVFARIQPLLNLAASEVTHCGGIGCGQIVKILNNMVLFETVVALSEALNIGRASGIDVNVLFETFTKGSADSFALRNHGKKALLPEEFPKKAFSTDYAIKDIDYAIALAEDAGIQARNALLTRELLGRASAAGFGDDYFPVVSRVIADRDPGTKS